MLNLLKNNKKLSVIIPVYKYEKDIKNNLQVIKKTIAQYFHNYEIIAVIDGKLDNSFNEAKKAKGIKVVGYHDNRGKGAAIKYGFQYCTGDYVTFIDCDLDINPQVIKNFIPYMSTAELVIGSKRHPFSKLKYPIIRKILSYLFHVFTFIILGIKLRDTQSGAKLIKKEVLDVIMPLILVKRYAFDAELCFLAQKHGFKMVEAPVNVDFGKETGSINSKTLIRTIYGMFVDVLAIRYRYSILKYYQKEYHKNRFEK